MKNYREEKKDIQDETIGKILTHISKANSKATNKNSGVNSFHPK
jgi:hypothetical protein